MLLNNKKSTRTYVLDSQLRVLGGKDYIKYIESILDNNADIKGGFSGYEFFIFDKIKNMVDLIKKKNTDDIICRNVSGYSWEWKTKKFDLPYIINNNLFDIEIKEGENEKPFTSIWNTQSDDWVNSRNAINEIGCIHTIQGYDLNFAGVIIGKELGYDEKKHEFIVRKEQYYDMNGKRNTIEKDLIKYILNIYKVLLTRGINGTYVYACDEGLRNYLKQYIPEYRKD